MITQLSYKQTPVSTFCLIKLVDGIQIFTECGLLVENWSKILLNKGLQSVFIDKHLSFHVHKHVLLLSLYCVLFIKHNILANLSLRIVKIK